LELRLDFEFFNDLRNLKYNPKPLPLFYIERPFQGKKEEEIRERFYCWNFRSEGKGRAKARTKEDCKSRPIEFKLDVRFSILLI
jgi:hypothetical protein